MRSDLRKGIFTLLLVTASAGFISGQLYEWRGPNRTGIYNESGLLKKWPDGGPSLVWEYASSGDGYSQPVPG